MVFLVLDLFLFEFEAETQIFLFCFLPDSRYTVAICIPRMLVYINDKKANFSCRVLKERVVVIGKNKF